MDQSAVDAEIAAAFAGIKKKKKKVVVIEEVQAVETPPPEDEQVEQSTEQQQQLDSMFGDMKKKKKKSKESAAVEISNLDEEGDESAPVASYPPMETAEGTADSNMELFNPSKKKKKKKTAFADFEAQIRAGEDGEEESLTQETLDEPWLSSNRDYTYNELLTRVFNILRAKNPEIRGEKRTYTIVPPAVSREGTKKTAFSNILDIAKRMRRQPDHVIQFLFAELGTSGSMDGSQRLVIKGRFQPKQIESVLKKYIVEYVSCKTCKSADTMLTKENRLFFVQCESCGSTRSVSAINKGFVAQLGKKPKAAE